MTSTTCKQFTLFSDCVNKQTLKVNICETESANVPKYYDCICSALREHGTCYIYCPDDPILQMEGVTKQQSTDNACSLAKSFQKNETVTATPTFTRKPYTASSPTATSSTSKILAPSSTSIITSSASGVKLRKLLFFMVYLVMSMFFYE